MQRVTTYYVTLTVTDDQTGQITTASKVIHFYPCVHLPLTIDSTRNSEGSHLVEVKVGGTKRQLISNVNATTAYLYQIDGRAVEHVKIYRGRIAEFSSQTTSGIYYIVLQGSDGALESHPAWYIR